MGEESAAMICWLRQLFAALSDNRRWRRWCSIVGDEDGNGAGSILGLFGPAVAEILADEMGEGMPLTEMAATRNKNKFLFWYKIYSGCRTCQVDYL